jgi:hypothetical protein
MLDDHLGLKVRFEFLQSSAVNSRPTATTNRRDTKAIVEEKLKIPRTTPIKIPQSAALSNQPLQLGLKPFK